MATIPNAVDAASIEHPAASNRKHQKCQENRALRALELWHLLSLDAPSVAVLWTWFLAKTNHIGLPVTVILAMGITVWILYAADRLLDARSIQLTSVILSGAEAPCISSRVPAPQFADLEPRHYFHRNHRKAFRFGILATSIALAFLLPELAPQSIRLYLALGTLLFGYFILIHVNSTNIHRLPKEIAVGVFFSAAIFIPTVARVPGLRLALLPGAFLFAAVCSLNCLFIYAWEHPSATSQTHATTEIALRLLIHLAAAAVVSGFILSIADHGLPWPVPIACATGTILLLLLHRNRQRFSPTTLRAAADLCLLTPLLLLPLLPR